MKKMSEENESASIPTVSEGSDSIGDVTVNLNVVANIVRIATQGISGVAEVGGSFRDQLTGFFTRKQGEGGVRVMKDEAGHYEIEVRVILNYGVQLGVVGGKIQEAVRSEVGRMTSNEVSRVDVIIDGIVIPEEENSGFSGRDQGQGSVL